MPNLQDNRVSEAGLGLAVLQILAATSDGTASVEKLKKELPKYVKLSGADQTPSETRLNEEIWEQQVRNLKSHDKVPGNVFAEGFVEPVSKGIWRITDAGKLHIKHKGLL